MLTKEKEYTCDYAQSHICILILLFIYYTPSTLSYYYLSKPLRSKQDNSTPIYIYSACVWGLLLCSYEHSFPFNIRTTVRKRRKRGACGIKEIALRVEYVCAASC